MDEQEMMKRRGFRHVKFGFFMDIYEVPIHGYTDDSKWNGFLNVWVTQKVHDQLNELYDEVDQFNADDDGLIFYGHGACCANEATIDKDGNIRRVP